MIRQADKTNRREGVCWFWPWSWGKKIFWQIMFFCQCRWCGHEKGDVKFEIFTTPRWGHPKVFEIDSWNFQQMLELGFSKPQEISVLLDNFFFKVSKAGPKEKCWKIAKTIRCFSIFFLWSPLRNYEKKSCLKNRKLCEVSENLKSSICRKFQNNQLKIEKRAAKWAHRPCCVCPL